MTTPTLYILRDGDLLSEPLDSFPRYTPSFVTEQLLPFGLVFSSREEADRASAIIRGVLLALSSLPSCGCRNRPSHTPLTSEQVRRYLQNLHSQSPYSHEHGQTTSEENGHIHH